jgi:hypothetical protein
MLFHPDESRHCYMGHGFDRLCRQVHPSAQTHLTAPKCRLEFSCTVPKECGPSLIPFWIERHISLRDAWSPEWPRRQPHAGSPISQILSLAGSGTGYDEFIEAFVGQNSRPVEAATLTELAVAVRTRLTSCRIAESFAFRYAPWQPVRLAHRTRHGPR